VFALTATYLAVEIIGGLMTGSLALLADGFHMFADAAAIGISLFAQWLSHRPASKHKTFGFQRVEIMAAFFNALLLLAMGLGILYESYERFQTPIHIRADLMLLIAVGGLLVNIISAVLLHADHQHNLNIKGAYLHVLGDLLGSAGAILAGLSVLFFGWTPADSLISMFIALLVIRSAVSLLWEAARILLEGCPSHLNIEEIRREILNCNGIQAVHHLHVWNINMQRTVLTAHLEVTPEAFSGETLSRVQQTLKSRFGLSHVTLQLELA
jgi:cobalt-zinc-cadmium efflux system protein